MALDRETRAFLRRLRVDLDQMTPQLRARIERALAQLRESVSVTALAMAIARRDQFALHDFAGTLPMRLRPALAVMSRMFATSFAASIKQVASQTRIGKSFSGVNAFAQEAAIRHGATMVAQVTNETRVAIRVVTAQAFAHGIPPREAAQLIKPLIGLTRRQAISAQRVYLRAVADGVGRQAARELAKRAADRLLRRRALLIARTETIKASTGGQMAGWRVAQQRGLLGFRAKKMWIVTEDDRLCPYCRAMDGATTFVGTDFVSVFGQRVSGPPLHPACRCAIGLTFEANRRAA